MSPAPSQNQAISWPHILTVALLAIGAIAAQWSIQPDRPIPSGQGLKARGVQDIDARLWQDPFGPISKTDALPKDENPRTLSDLTNMAHQANVRVIAVLVSGGKWVGADEARRRTRYATLSGLMVEGYTPHDPEHIGYVEAHHVLGTDLRMPYEWMEYGGTDKEKPELVLVLWVDEDALLVDPDDQLDAYCEDGSTACGGPLARLDEIRSKFAANKNFSFSIIGPSSSTLLVAANEEVRMNNRHGKLLSGTPWYSPLATLPKAKITDFLKAGPASHFIRLIATDDQLAQALAHELSLRDIGKNDVVTLIGQRDTAYSRELMAQVKTALDHNPKKLIEYGYLRGIDGRLPGTGNTQDSKKTDDKNTGSKTTDWSNTERPEGDSQIDYLRRMVGQLERRQQQDGPIKAIGIFGDDYYDKLLIMKAMHPAFPQAVFFTTDLNAAMLHPSDNHDARNLVVASGYGLTLNPGLQQGVPPFRDSYETASFVAARLAASSSIGENRAEQWRAPQIFEIGRSEAVPLTGPNEVDTCNQFADCKTLQLPVARPPWSAAFVLPVIMGLLLVTAFASGAMERRKTARKTRIISLLMLAATTVASVALIAWLRVAPVKTEPFSWVQGVSIWPSELLRLIATALSLVLIARGKYLLTQSREDIESRFKLKQPTAARAADSANGGTPAIDIWRIYVGDDKDRSARDQLPLYLRLSYPKALLVFIALMFAFGVMTMALFPFTPPNTPARGPATFVIDAVTLWLAVLAFWSVLFFALYKTLRANWLAKQHAERTAWPPQVYARLWPKALEGEADPHVFNDWMGARLIAHATEPIQRIVFYPFLVLALLIFARSSLFDGWHIPGELYIIFGLPIFIMAGAAWPLRARAEKVREESLRWLHVRLMEEQASGRDKLAAQIRTMIEQVEYLRTGAFAPFSERPLFKGVLTLVGSLSGVALLDYANQLGF
jgi:hypothetical protein